MKNRSSTLSLLSRALLPALLVASLCWPAAAAEKKFAADTNHTVLGFTSSTVLFDVSGRFDKYKVDISGDPDTAAGAKVMLAIEARSINTGNSTRDNHLRSPDFFDADKYPRITFVSSKVTRHGDKVEVEGTLDMHGVKKQITIAFDAVAAKNGAGVMEHVYKAEVPLSRKDFGIGADSVAAKISLKDEVKLNLLLAGFFG